METLVVGLDAATPEVIDRLRCEGRLPNIDAVYEAGVGGPMKSTVPPMTPAAWTSMSTGVNPGKHGIFDFLEPDTDARHIVPTDYTENPYPEIWRVFEHFGVDVGVVNYPLVYPASDAASVFVSGIPASVTDDIVRPKSLKSVLTDHGFHLHPQVTPEAGQAAYYDAVCEQTETQRDVALHVLEEYDLDVFVTVFMGLDWVQHYLWSTEIDGEDAVDQFYVKMDEIVGQLVDAVGGDTNIVLVSDHGAGPIDGEVHLNSWLADKGYLTRREDGDASDDIVKELSRGFWSLGTELPDGLKRVIKQVVPGTVLDEAKQRANIGQRGMCEEIDWERTFAFSYGYMGKIMIHNGADLALMDVEGDNFDTVRQALIKDLESLTNPDTGSPIVSSVATGENLYDGNPVERAPDLQLHIKDWRYLVYGDFDNEWFHPPSDRIADHRPKGIFAAAGPDIATGAECALAAVDVAPTLLALQDTPPLAEMDGEVLETVLAADPPLPVSMETMGEADGGKHERGDDVRNRLEDLGYL